MVTHHFSESHKLYIITTLPGDLCGNITEFGVVEGSSHLSPQVEGDPLSLQTVTLPYRSPDKGCFVFISYCLNNFMLFPAKLYEINVYLLLYLSFQIKV